MDPLGDINRKSSDFDLADLIQSNLGLFVCACQTCGCIELTTRSFFSI